MPYIENKIVQDVDAHTMELPNLFDDYGDQEIQKAFRKKFDSLKDLNLERLDSIEINFYNKNKAYKLYRLNF